MPHALVAFRNLRLKRQYRKAKSDQNSNTDEAQSRRRQLAQTFEKSEADRTFKRIGVKLELVFRHLNAGMDVVEKFDAAETETEREIYALLVKYSLHDSWHTLTKLMRQIAQDFDHDTPKGKGAAQTLVDRMTQRTSERNRILSLAHIDTTRRIGQIHRDVRQSKLTRHSASEVIELFVAISDDIVPDIMENIRVLALASPGGAKLVGYLRPKSDTDFLRENASEKLAS
jgi:hypothetical protein